MANETRTDDQVLEDQIREARQSTITGLHTAGRVDHTNGHGESREDKRLKVKYLNELDGLVQKFMEARSTFDDPDGQLADDKLVYFNNLWLHTCSRYNKRPRAKFSLRVDAFMDRVTSVLDSEKAQVKAAKDAYQTNSFDKWLRRTWIDYKWRRKWYRLKRVFTKKTVKEQMRAYWETI